MMRILQVIPTLDRSGAEKQLTLLASRLPRDEFAVEVCALTRGGPYESDLVQAGVPVTVLHKRLKVDPVAAWRLGAVIKRGQFDIVHTWLFAANSYGRMLARRHRVPVIIASERCADHWKGTAELSIDRRLAPSTDAIVVNARAVARFYEDAGFDPAKLVLIPNGYEEGPSRPIHRAQLLEELELPADARLVGFVGRLWPQKRVQDLIWAIELIRNIKPNVFGVICGDGPDRDTLADFVAKVGIGSRIRFLGMRDDVPHLLPEMEVFVLPSEFEGMSNSLLEAMGAGLPVVATDIPGNDELVIDGENGFLVPVGDTKMLTTKLNQLLDSESMRSQFGQAGRRRIRNDFSVAKMVDSHVRLYRELANRKHVRSDHRG